MSVVDIIILYEGTLRRWNCNFENLVDVGGNTASSSTSHDKKTFPQKCHGLKTVLKINGEDLCYNIW